MNVSMCIIGHYRWPDYFVNVHEQSPCVTLSEAKGLSVAISSKILRFAQDDRLDLAGGEDLSRSFEPYLSCIMHFDKLIRSPICARIRRVCPQLGEGAI